MKKFIIRLFLLGFILNVVFTVGGFFVEDNTQKTNTKEVKQTPTKLKGNQKATPKKKVSKQKSTKKGFYTPKKGATLAASQNCWSELSNAVLAGDESRFQQLINSGCVLVYDPNRNNLELILYEAGGIDEPNVYLIKGKSNSKVWALRSQMIEK